jgi:hypothetical protein
MYLLVPLKVVFKLVDSVVSDTITSLQVLCVIYLFYFKQKTILVSFYEYNNTCYIACDVDVQFFQEWLDLSADEAMALLRQCDGCVHKVRDYVQRLLAGVYHVL